MNSTINYEYLIELAKQIHELQTSPLPKLVARIKQAKHDCVTVYVIGNGGSYANAAHLVLHLREAGVCAVDLLGDAANLTAMSNDHSYQDAARLILKAEATRGDILVVISGSGDSANILLALAEAKRKGIWSFGLLGFGGGTAFYLCDEAVVLSSHNYGVVEDVHSTCVHLIKDDILREDEGVGDVQPVSEEII